MTKILVTNDDGWMAPGIALLAEAAANFGEVTVVAPEVEQSGMSHRITFDRPLAIQQKSTGFYSVDGTPADCVRIAIAKLGGGFDWVLSGINDGANLGVEIFYSGTVAAAREATLLGVPAIGLSQYRVKYLEAFDWSQQKNLVERLLGQMLTADERKPGKWLNLNLPDPSTCPESGPQVIECRADYSALPNQYSDTNGGAELDFKYRERPRQEGRDVEVCFGGHVALTRLALDV